MIKKIMSFIILIISLILVPILPVTASENSNEKIIYLTFDDGPSNKIMPNILDTLKKEQVNATFFIIGDQIKGNEKILKRVHEEGHSIGLHSVTHKKCNLYSSNDCFLKEMLKDQKLINEVVGISPTILRFPYGAIMIHINLLNQWLIYFIKIILKFMIGI